MYKIKNAAKRGSALLGAVGLLVGVGASAVPAFQATASADALNPLTERSLSLSSSSPGWAFTDGSGNSTYAGPNTGTNGQKTGNFFSFRTSSDATIKAFTFQYCTTPAGTCIGPGDDAAATSGSPGTPRGSDTSTTSDLSINLSSPSEVASSDYTSKLSQDGTGATAAFANVKQVPDGQDTVSPYSHDIPPDPNGVAGNFVVLYGTSATGFENTFSSGWTMAASNLEDGTVTQNTGKDNMITMTNSTGIHLHPGDYVKIMFFGTDTNYITNPGSGAFFVKINDFDNTTNNNPVTDPVIDGGVTVANVMNQSIEIQTKVLETMDFSVGTVDPDTLAAGASSELSTAYPGHTAHGQCDPILPNLTNSTPANVLSMGNSSAEDSLMTSKTFATHSYWRLSSNSSGGATVYYAGNTLSNTENNMINPIGATAANPVTGTEQFGLALDHGTNVVGGHDLMPVDYSWATADTSPALAYEQGADYSTTTHGAALSSDWNPSGINPDTHDPQLYPLVPTTNYGGASGGINQVEDGNTNSSYAYTISSQTVPTAIATESSQVVDCVTGKMRYIANIAATTPAGIYTTKINYIAAPQY